MRLTRPVAQEHSSLPAFIVQKQVFWRDPALPDSIASTEPLRAFALRVTIPHALYVLLPQRLFLGA